MLERIAERERAAQRAADDHRWLVDERVQQLTDGLEQPLWREWHARWLAEAVAW